MIRKNINKIMSMALLFCLCMTSPGMAPKNDHVNLLVVPARYSVLQVAFDVADSYPTVLVSYQGGQDGRDPLLYAWNGTEWVFVTLDDYARARFLQIMPSRIILVGGDDLMPQSLVEASNWGSMVVNVPSVDTATLINSLANIYGFSSRDWRWFAVRYNLDLIDLNEEQRKDSWYDHPYVEPGDTSELGAYEDRISYQRESYLLEEPDNTYVIEEDVFIEEKVIETPPDGETRREILVEESVRVEEIDKGDLSPPPFMTHIEGWEEDEPITDPYPIK